MKKTGKNSDYWLCTSCHKEVYSKSNVYLFDILQYNFDHKTEMYWIKQYIVAMIKEKSSFVDFAMIA